MSIPFTQYLRSNGRRRDVEIDMPQEVENLARRFIAAGGRYECEELTTGHASLTAVYEIDGEDQDIAIEVCRNGPGVPERVEKLVRGFQPSRRGRWRFGATLDRAWNAPH